MRRTLISLALGLWSGQARAFTPEQVEHGRQLFPRCSECHTIAANDESRGARNWPLVGDEALPSSLTRDGYPPFALDTAGQVADFIQTSMPLHSPGTLKPDEALALTALILSANGVEADARPLTLEEANTLTLNGLLPARRARRHLWVGGLLFIFGITLPASVVLLRKRRRQ